MRKKLIRNLLFTFLLSLLLTGLLFAIWYGREQRGFEEGQALKLLMFVGDIFQNFLLLLSALPMMFLTNEDNYNNRTTRLFYYFGGPVIFTTIFVLFIGNGIIDKLEFLLPGISFMALHLYFYTTLKINPGKKSADN